MRDNLAASPTLEEIAACPRCLGHLAQEAGRWRCANHDCSFAAAGFPSAAGQPVLIDFDKSLFRRDDYDPASPRYQAAEVNEAGSESGGGWRDWLRDAILGTNRKADRQAYAMLRDLKQLSPTPRLLIIGGGTLGAGTQILYNDPSIQIVGTDVYPTPTTRLLADAHCLPFQDGMFDGVWIQAVLEHVLEPEQVVAQIHRVLKPRGVVYAETPFLFPVHMAAHDFTRYTLSGHRWLFRRFEQIDAGVLGGAGSATLWSVRFLWRALGVGDKAATLLTLPVFWLRYLDGIARGQVNADAALGVFFLGRKAEAALTPRDMIPYYELQ